MKRLVFICILAAVTSCQENLGKLTDRVMATAVSQFSDMDSRLGPDAYPKTFQDGQATDSPQGWWCSGFFPGSLWYVYEWTGSEQMKELAWKHTLRLSDLSDHYTDHDLGFQMNCSFGNALRLTGCEDCLPVLEKTAAKLAARFSPVVKCIRSWDNDSYTYPVIIDNMMNLEHLLNCAELFGCDSLREVACTHANTTLRNHFREDWSSYHLVDYNPEDGSIIRKQTKQGWNDESAWSRGQAWGLYGFTMMYERTGIDEYLDAAENIARYNLDKLPEDGVPYWDYDAPELDGVILRDASAGAIMASAFAKLSKLSRDRGLASRCRKTAVRQVRTLAGREYLAEPGTNGGFLLKHGVGFMLAGSEVDVPLTYSDYYFLEALVLLNK